MSLKSSNAQLNVELRSEAQVKDWLTGIKTVLTSRSGRNFNLKEDDPSASKQVKSSSGGRFNRRSFSVIKANDPNNSREATSQGSYGEKGERARNMMQDGAMFNHFSFNHKGYPVCTHVFVFLNPAKGKLGTFFWCPPGKRVENHGTSVPLHMIIDLFVGKQTEVFAQSVAQDALKDCCFTLRTSKAALDLEAETVEQVILPLVFFRFGVRFCRFVSNNQFLFLQANTWLSGIKYILENKGMPAPLDEEVCAFY